VDGPQGGLRRVGWVAAPFLASGAALLVYIVSGVSLRWTFLGLGLVGAAAFAVVLRRMPAADRRRINRRVGIGAFAGLIATVGYDVVRLGLVEFADLQLRPFEAWRLFGMALTDSGQSGMVVMVAGTLFHLFNGVAFGIAYTLAFGHRGAWAGIAWALILEAFMVSVYPGWLGLKALDEFLSVSIAGHLVYGSLLGGLAKSILGRAS
jgi:hypothetical protein